MKEQEESWISGNQLILAIMKYPQIKEKYVKKFEYLFQKDGPRDIKKRQRIEELLGEFSVEIIQLQKDFQKDDEKEALVEWDEEKKAYITNDGEIIEKKKDDSKTD